MTKAIGRINLAGSSRCHKNTKILSNLHLNTVNQRALVETLVKEDTNINQRQQLQQMPPNMRRLVRRPSKIPNLSQKAPAITATKPDVPLTLTIYPRA
jgi:hypothetical protein